LILRDILGVEALGNATARFPKSLMRMFGPKGNPQARNLFEIIACIQEHEGIHFKINTPKLSDSPFSEMFEWTRFQLVTINWIPHKVKPIGLPISPHLRR
jgi:hypothetical protein